MWLLRRLVIFKIVYIPFVFPLYKEKRIRSWFEDIRIWVTTSAILGKLIRVTILATSPPDLWQRLPLIEATHSFKDYANELSQYFSISIFLIYSSVYHMPLLFLSFFFFGGKREHYFFSIIYSFYYLNLDLLRIFLQWIKFNILKLFMIIRVILYFYDIFIFILFYHTRHIYYIIIVVWNKTWH